MPFSTPPIHEAWELLTAFVISLISGTISITRRIAMGHKANILWVTSEFLTAILCGYLMFHSYPLVAPFLPEWITLPIAVAFVAHSGGRIFQEMESTILNHYSLFTNRPKK